MSSSSSLPLVTGSSYYHHGRHKTIENKENGNGIYGFASKSDTITIDKGHYENLLRISQQFENVKRSLLGGGVSRENFDVLANDSIASPSPAESRATDSYYSKPQSPRNTFGSRPVLFSPSSDDRNGETPSPDESIEENEFDTPERNNKDEKKKPVFDDAEKRTVEIRNLPERTAHIDLTNAIRGGALLEIYLRWNDNSARVAFADSEAAREFLERAKRHGFQIGNKRVDVSWSDRQFFLRPYIRQNIEHGASRNLAIHNINPNITAALIREHLEHIHNLVVVDIRFDYVQSIAYISTNSVHNAMFARSCMKSRAAYRGMKIDFTMDECAQPYENEQYHTRQHQYHQYQAQNSNQNQRRAGSVNKRTKHDQRQQRQGGVLVAGSSLSNRFEMLSVESPSSESEGDSETETDMT